MARSKSSNDNKESKEFSLIPGVKAALRRRGINPDVAAECRRASADAGLNRRFLEQILNGTVVSPRTVNLRKLAQFLGTSEQDLTGGSNGVVISTLPFARTDPRISPLGVGIEIETQAIREYDIRASTADQERGEMVSLQQRPVVSVHQVPTSLLAKLHPNAEPAVIRIAGNSMEPDYPAGSCVLVDASVRVPSPDGDYVIFDGFSYAVKRCQVLPGKHPAEIRVSAINAGYIAHEVLLSALWVCGLVVAVL